ncbi:uncharacterized protein [Littorina saxatilis]|uniref:uncharacterized protein isoform X2 n=1 Tax=Littorina saxatilis TaxID=31220 RepID=UPI0038B4A216
MAYGGVFKTNLQSEIMFLLMTSETRCHFIIQGQEEKSWFVQSVSFVIKSGFHCAECTLFVAAILSVVTPLTTECSRVRAPCSDELFQDQVKNMEPCAAGQKYLNCLASALDNAERNGLCDKLSVYAFRYDSLREAQSYDRNCQSFNIPSTLQQPECQTEMAVCGASVLRALGADNGNDNKAKCRELDGFKVCMEGQTSSCQDRLSVQTFIQAEMTSFQYQNTCVASVNEACSRIRSTCEAQKYKEQQQNYPPCQYEQDFFNCLARDLSKAERENTCEELALTTFRYNSFRSSRSAVANCPEFTTPPYFQLDACQQDMGTCGTFAINVFVANRDNNDVTKCSELDGFKSCMETKTTNCADRQKINTMLQQDLTYYEYQSSCLETTSSTTTTTTTTQKPVTQKPTATQKPGGTGPVLIGGGPGGSGNRIHPFTVVTIGLALIVSLLRV